MKKLMLAVATIALAVCAQAATVKWTGANIYEMGSTETKATGYLVYFISSSDYSLSKATADLNAKKTAFVSTYGVASATTSSGAAMNTITTSAGNSESWTGYLVIFNDSTINKATYAYITSEATKATGAAGQAANLAFTNNTGTQTAGNWKAVPEPTSGLLLLLGMAGLALKRKHA